MSQKKATSAATILRSLAGGPGCRRHGKPARRPRRALGLERLEDRLLLANFTVTNNSDNPLDTGSLRFAVNHLSAGQSNQIHFAPQLSGGNTITLAQANGPLVVF